MSTTSSAVDEATLPEALVQGLEAIRSRVLPDVSVIDVIDNFATLDLGSMGRDGSDLMEELPAIYEEKTVRLFARVALNFPHAEPYGLVTVPTLHRVDRQPIDRQHSAHPIAQRIAAALGESDAAFWSWNWSGMPRRTPADLAAVVEWARKRIREG
jgi:hypothetical protein